MVRNKKLLSFLCCLLFALVIFAEPGITKENLKKDILFIKETLPARHVNLFFKQSKEEFDKSMDDLYKNADNLSENQILFGMIKNVADIGDGHTSLFLGNLYSSFSLFPLTTYFLDDGLFITQIHDEYSGLLGKKIVKVNNIPIDEVISRISQLISRENEYRVKQQFSNFFIIYEVLNYLGITNEKEIVLTLENNGQFFDAKIKSESFNEYMDNTKWNNYFILNAVNLDYAYTNNNRYYWYKQISSSTLYFCYNVCADEEENPFDKFTAEMFKEIENNQIKNIIVDLRNNSGGNSTLFSYNCTPQLEKLIKEKGVKVYYMTGRNTFSSGMFAVAELSEIGGISYGEPTGNKPNHYGEIGYVQSENTGLFLVYSKNHFILFKDNYENTYTPQIPVKTYSKDIFNGIDPVMTKILEDINNSKK